MQAGVICHSSSTGTTAGNERIAPISGHLLAVGLIWENKCAGFACKAMSPGPPRSLHLLDCWFEIVGVPHSAAQTTFGFLPGKSLNSVQAQCCQCVLVIE